MSLTGHHMPPRTTQQSHRPRVSDRTMVGTLPPRCLQALPHGTKNAATDGPGYRATPRSTTEPHTGLDARHLPSPSPCGRGEVFSLDIPFYRTRRETGKVGQLARAPNEKTTPFRPAGKRCFLLVHLVIREDLDAVPLSE